MNILNNVLLNAVVVILLSGSSTYLGILAYRQDKTSPSNSIFTRFSIATALWILLAYIPDIPYFRNFALVSAKLNYIALLTVSFTIFQLPQYFPQQRKMNIYVTYVVLGIAVILGVLTLFTNKVIAGLNFFEWGASYVDGELAGPFYLYMMAGPIAALGQYIYRWRNYTELDKRKVRLFLIGLFIFMTVNIFIQSIVKPLIVQTDEFYKVGNYSAIFMIGFTSYAIIKYNLFDIKVLTTELLTAALVITLFSRLLISQSPVDTVINGIILILVLIFGVLLIKSVMNEVKQREELQKLTQKLQEMDKQKDEFISMAAHELRAPMTAIKGYLSMVMEGDTGDIPEKARGFLADANSINERLIRLVNNMLNVNRIEEGRLVYQLEHENLSEITRAVFHQFIPEAERKGLKLDLEIPRELKDGIYVDADKLNEVIGNLISNAVKYTDTGGVTVSLKQPDNKTVRFEVADTGPGIPEEAQQKLFRKFYRVESNVGKTTGTGLGLYISKLLIEKFGGRIGVNSELNKGSTFWFEIPLPEDEKEDTAN